MSAIGDEATKQGAVFLRIDPEILESDSKALEVLKDEGFKKSKKEIQPRATFILDLTKSLEEIKANFENKFRYKHSRRRKEQCYRSGRKVGGRY